MAEEEHRGRIVTIAATNRPDLLDPATVDRFAVVLPFLHPTISEVEELLPVLAKQLGRTLESDVDAAKIARHPSLRYPTARALLEVLVKAGLFADHDAQTLGSPIAQAHLEEAAALYRPNYNPLEHEAIALEAIRMTNFDDCLPWMTRKGYRPTAEVPAYLEGIVDPATGKVDLSRLCARLRELRGR
jgi:SpoVK/Ycf46/Vps4 family AAA+-type ATPase